MAEAALTLTAGSNATTTPNVATSITGFQIVGPSASTTPVKLRATSGTLSLSVVSGVTMSGNNSGTVSLSGTVEKLNQALTTLKYTRASTGTDTLEVSLVESGEVFFDDNGHLYKFISGSINATNASTPSAATTTAVAVSATATSTLSNNSRQLTVVTPVDFTATSSSIVIQIKSLVSDTVIGAVGRPSSSLVSAAVVAFDVTALIDNETVLDSFDVPVTITYAYTDSDVANIDESTIWLYHYHDGSWDALDDCVVNTVTNTITCTTPNFSVFGLFGTQSSTSVSGSVQSGVTLAGRIAYFLGAGNISSALELLREYLRVFFGRSVDTVPEIRKIDPVASAPLPVRDLELGMRGSDVLKLQRFLNDKGYLVAVSGDGSPGNETEYFGRMTQKALTDYQKANGVVPAMGYLGAFTREHIRTLDSRYVWW